MPSASAGDPRYERAANDELPAPAGRCPCCHAPLPAPPIDLYGRTMHRPGRRRKWCGDRCRLFAWRRNGDPDGPLDHLRADATYGRARRAAY